MAVWVFVVVSASVTLFSLLMAVFGFYLYRVRRRDVLVTSRLALGAEEEAEEQQIAREGKTGIVGLFDSMLKDASLHDSLLTLLEQAGETSTPGSLMIKIIFWSIGPAFVMGIVTMEPGVALVSMVFGLLPVFLLLRKRVRRMQQIDAQLPVALEIMMLSLRAGHSLAQTITLSSRELQSPLRDEFARVSEEHELGRNMEESLQNMSRRLPRCRALRTFVVAVMVLQQTGGNLIEVIERIIGTLRMQSQYERKLQAMTAEGRNSARMVGAMPVAFVGLAYLADPGYIGVLFTDPLGQKLLAVCIVLWLLGVLWTQRLVKPAQ